MANQEVFESLAKGWRGVTLHNVKLLDVRADANGFEELEIEYQGETRTIAGGGRWREDSWLRREIGRVGCVVPADPVSGLEMPKGACYFRAYIDPSLRRAPEFDLLDAVPPIDGRRQAIIGWRCERHPEGFRAPLGIIPGENGAFVPDQTEVVTLRIPPEFIRECRAVQCSPEQVLRGFVGDLAGITNYVKCPRADGYGSNGSDESDYAEAWLDRAYGMHRVDFDALEAADAARRDREDEMSQLECFLDEFVDNGGTGDDFLNAVEAIVERQLNREHQ